MHNILWKNIMKYELYSIQNILGKDDKFHVQL
jgi:hypothetical protein